MQAPVDHAALAPHWRPRPTTLRIRSAFTFLSIDLVAILAGFGAAAATRTVLLGGTDWLLLILTLLPVYIAVALNTGAYTSDNLRNPLRAVSRAMKAITIAIAATVLIGFSLKVSDSLPRTVAVFGFILASLLMGIGRWLFVRHFEFVIGGDPFGILLINDGGQPVPPGAYSVVVTADAYFDPAVHDPVMYDRLARTLQSADRVVILCVPERRALWTNALKGASVQGEIVVPEFAPLAPLGIDSYGDTPTMVVSTGPLGLIDRTIKRSFDIVLAGIAMLFLSPLFAAVAIAIKLDSRGPIFFRQTRIGRGNEMFRVLKFRSMIDAEADSAGHRSAMRNDERVTRVGRFIRSASIDELPQLINILKGDMSIVGPRPHALGSRAAEKLFWEVDERYWHRHAAKPGLTGLAQVRGFRGATLLEADLANRLQADLEYLENWSIWRDITIILLTFRVVFHRNAF